MIHLSLVEKIWDVLHCISTDACNISVGAWMQFPKGCNPILYVLRDFHSNFQS